MMTTEEREIWERFYFEAVFGKKLISNAQEIATKAVTDFREAKATLKRGYVIDTVAERA